MEKTIITDGKYKFQIVDNILLYDEKIYCRNIKIGGSHTDCVNISISYKDNEPVSAYIPHIMYSEDCSIEPLLDRGQGTIRMIKTLFNYIQEKIPSIKEINFEDKSNIECATDIEKDKKSKLIKKGTIIYPIPLYYFSIAFNGETWYEKNFNAKQKNKDKHDRYKEKVINLLSSKEVKQKNSYIDFLRIAQPPADIIDELEKIYNTTDTYESFFQSMPKIDRCRLVRDWIFTFMSYHLKDVFDNTDWMIELPIETKGVGGRRGGGKKSRKYYCPKGRIIHNKTYKDLGVDLNDV